MTVWACIPVKPPHGGKSRLAPVLSPVERREMAGAMLARVVSAGQASALIDTVCLVGTARNGLPESLRLLPDPGRGLNPALQGALEIAVREGVSRLVLIHGDLPRVTASDLDALARVPEGIVGIAPDRHGTGTNALSLPLPPASGFRFAFGIGSFARHRREAARIGSPALLIETPGLACDVDDPADLADAADLLETVRARRPSPD
ncbi:MAG: 2-phospho-L-lactate guanylyltransferase [Novosphingobium sp.]|nr:2-phospho-L-lactate guanylyltransferase [Novosphingobium sp.]